MIGVERLRNALRIVAASVSVKNGSGPVSANLIAPSDAGKSELILSSQPPGAIVVNDFTFATLIQILSQPKPPSYLVVPDLNVVISHKPAVASLAMALLLSLMAEGVTDIPGIDEPSKLKAKKLKERGVRVARLTGMTPEMFKGKRGQWRNTGFLRRMVPIHYAYSEETQAQIQHAIAGGADGLKYFHVRAPRVKPAIVHIPEPVTDALRQLSEQVTRQLSWSRSHAGRESVVAAQAYPFSPHKTLRQLARASALIHGRSRVIKADIAAVKDIAKFMRYDRPEEI